MFGKRTGQPSGEDVAPRPAAVAQPAGDAGAQPPQPAQGHQTQAFAYSAEKPAPSAGFASSGGRPADAPPSPAADRLDALAARPKPASAPGNGPGPKATSGFEQLKKAQAVAEIVREQSDYHHATKTTIFNALMNTIDLAQLAQLDTKAASEEILSLIHI